MWGSLLALFVVNNWCSLGWEGKEKSLELVTGVERGRRDKGEMKLVAEVWVLLWGERVGHEIE